MPEPQICNSSWVLYPRWKVGHDSSNQPTDQVQLIIRSNTDHQHYIYIYIYSKINRKKILSRTLLASMALYIHEEYERTLMTNTANLFCHPK